ncbi:5-formyltetrahydrofolate cyclo-ligase [Aquiluna sp.]|nr:5-formyltetrahydrofolate cyclo-ligase [Aquiluna sp.]
MDYQGKKELRAQLTEARPHSAEGLTEQLAAIFSSSGAKTIASYVPLANEPDVSEFNRLAAQSTNLVLPRIMGDSLEFASGEQVQGPFGIYQPSGEAVELASIELMLVPALAVDEKGNRLGKGKGFYDRVLGSFRGLSVAVVFDGEVIEAVPSESHDQRVAMIATPLRTLVVG